MGHPVVADTSCLHSDLRPSVGGKLSMIYTGPTTSSRHCKNIKLPPVLPPLPLVALSITGIGGVTGGNFIFFSTDRYTL